VTGVSIRLLAPDDDAAAIGEMEDPRPRQAIEQARAWYRLGRPRSQRHDRAFFAEGTPSL
jgi:hypothetical protein